MTQCARDVGKRRKVNTSHAKTMR